MKTNAGLLATLLVAAALAPSAASAGLEEDGQPFTGPIHANQTASVISGGLNITCAEGEIGGEIEDAGWPATGHLGISFDECGAEGVGPCTYAFDGPYALHVEESSETTGHFIVEGPIGVEMTCLGGAIMCDYTFTDGFEGSLHEGPGAEVDIVDQPLSSPACGPAVWNAHFDLEEDEGADIQIGEKF